MNLIAIDIGNTTIKVAFYLNDEEKLLKSVDGNSGNVESQLADILVECWDQAPLVERAKEPVKECVLVAGSVKPEWTGLVRDVVKDELGQKLLVIGQDVPLPMRPPPRMRLSRVRLL
jgi:pantothenate kinase type III